MLRRARVNSASLAARALLAILALPSAAHAGDHTRLLVTRDKSAAECPDERALRDAVGARLGYEPFTSDAPSLVVVTFRREGATLLATVQLHAAAGKVKGERTLSSARGDCEELASTTALTISILLDPRSALAPPNPPEKATEPEPKSEPVADTPATPPAIEHPPDPAPLPAAVPPEPVLFRLTAAGTGSIGIAPAPGVGFLVGAGVEYRRWSASAEFRADLPASRAIGALSVRTAFSGGSVVPCAYLGLGYACGVLSLGVIRGEVVGASPSSQSTFQLLLGPRVGLSIPLVRWLSLDGHVDASYAPTRTTLRVAENDVWATPHLSGLLGIGFVERFP
jgi:hypothetical protein